MNDWSDTWAQMWMLLPFTYFDAETAEVLAEPERHIDPALDGRRTNALI